MTIPTGSMLTRAIALNEVEDVARSPDHSLGLLVFIFIKGEVIAFFKKFNLNNR
ncbi:hypothetical protein [Pseudanabaena biceps]|uniref:hypothetical protein n=1 Tax=Pseudanabaena biceps TaxID=927669 RepID=UPI00030C8F2B|nr:hypothetical protein [Pseudanabaena biceps]